MEQTPLPPLVSDAQITWRSMCAENGVIVEEMSFNVGAYFIRDLYEAHRAKTREVVQALVDKAHHSSKCEYLYESNCDCGLTAALALAKSQLQIEPEAMNTFVCNACGGHEVISHRTSSYVCPWCGDGVMQIEEEPEETEEP